MLYAGESSRLQFQDLHPLSMAVGQRNAIASPLNTFTTRPGVLTPRTARSHTPPRTLDASLQSQAFPPETRSPSGPEGSYPDRTYPGR